MFLNWCVWLAFALYSCLSRPSFAQPPNAAVFQPGPALLFVVVDGVPSIGKQIMVGSGEIGEQPTAEVRFICPSALIRAYMG